MQPCKLGRHAGVMDLRVKDRQWHLRRQENAPCDKTLKNVGPERWAEPARYDCR